jgi:uncharacterized protein YukE
MERIMPSYSYNENLLVEIEQNMNAESRALRSQLDNLERGINSHLAEWNDEAKELYFQSKAQWNAQAAELPIKLAAVQQAVGGVRDVLTNATRNAIRTFS